MATKDFSQYLAEARAKYGTAPATKVVAPKTPLAKMSAGGGKGQDPLSWLVDILSRPLRAVENVPNQILDEQLKRKQAEQLGVSYNEVGGAFNIATAPLRGFFSNNPADQPTGADLIEKTYDVENYGKIGYKDKANNVNEIAKAAGGLSMDIALDPLTWIPGAQFAKGGQLIAKGAKGALAGADALVAGSNIGDALGASSRIASRLEKTKVANEELNTQLALQPYLLQDTAFGAKMPKPSAGLTQRLAATDAMRPQAPVIPGLAEKAASAIPETINLAEDELKLFKKAQRSEARAAKKEATATTAVPEAGVDTAAMMDKVGDPSTIAAQYQATGKIPDIMAQLDLIKPGITEARVSETLATLPDVAPQVAALEAKVAKLVKDSAAAATSPTVAKRVDAQIKAARAEIKALKAQKKVTVAKPVDDKAGRAFSASTALKNVLTDPVKAQAMKDALGEGVVAQLLSIKTPTTLVKATDHLGKVIRGEIEQGASKIQNDLARELHKNYDIKVPGTDSPAIVGTSAVDTPLTAEAQVANLLGQDLKDVPWLGNYTPEQIEEVIRVMPDYLKEDFLNVRGYDFTTGRGALSTSDIKGAGKHKFFYEFNQYDQWTLLERLVASDRKAIAAHNIEMRKVGDRAAVIAAANRADIIKRAAINKVELALKWFDSKGASAWIGVKDTRIRLYAHQMLREFNLANGRGLDLAYFNQPTSIPMTNLMDAVVALYTKADLSDEALSKILRKEIKGADNFLLQGKSAEFGHRPGAAKPSVGTWRPNKEDGTNKVIGWYRMWSPAEVEAETIAMLRGSADNINATVLHNEEMALARNIAEQRDLSKSVITKLIDEANDPALLGSNMRKIADLPAHVGDEGAANFVKPEVQPVVAKPVVDYWPNDVVHDGQHVVDLVKAAAKDPEAARKALLDLGVSEAKYAGKNAEEIIALRGSHFDGVGANGKVVNEAMYNDAVNEMAFNDMLSAGRVSKYGELVQYRKGKEQVIHKYDQVHHQMSIGNADFKLQRNAVAAAHSGLIPDTQTSFLAQALRDMARGTTSTGEIAAAREALKPLVHAVFGNPADGAEAMGIWQRAGGDLTDLQVYMRKAKLPYTVDLTNAETRFKKGEATSLVAAGMEDWKNWVDEIDDPLKFLTDMYWAGSMLHADKSAAALFVARAGVTSSKPRAGYSLIPDVDLFEHPLIGHMPKGTYIKNDILQEVNNIERMVMSDYSPKSAFGKFLNEKYLPLLGTWKKGVTIYRLGHHVRNLLSSEGIQWTVEGNRHYLGSGSAAMKVLMKHKSYEGVDWAQTVTELDTLRMPTGGDMLFTFGNKEITVDALYEAAEKNALFTDFRVIEDLFDDVPKTKFSEVVDRVGLKDTKLEKLAGGLSEYQSHFSRLHHFTQILMKEGKKGKNWEQAVEAAAKKVRRHHPDGVTLTPFERAYLKPAIPFYSWFRQMIPVIAEGLYQNPGRFMVYPKASYNLAVAMGVDPVSIQDPFPEGELFPSFVTDQLTGPVAQINGNYFTAQPGYAYADILNQFVADPTKGAIGMLTPFIKVPGELITGTKWDTGVSIKDYSDYVDAQLPGINYLSNFTGTSVTGSVGSILTGQGIDRQYNVDKGNKTVLDQGLSVSNWFTGLGLQNVSKENYRNLAEIQMRDAAKAEADRQAGTARSPF